MLYSLHWKFKAKINGDLVVIVNVVKISQFDQLEEIHFSSTLVAKQRHFQLFLNLKKNMNNYPTRLRTFNFYSQYD